MHHEVSRRYGKCPANRFSERVNLAEGNLEEAAAQYGGAHGVGLHVSPNHCSVLLHAPCPIGQRTQPRIQAKPIAKATEKPCTAERSVSGR